MLRASLMRLAGASASAHPEIALAPQRWLSSGIVRGNPPPLLIDGSNSSFLDPTLNIHKPGTPRIVLHALMDQPHRIRAAHEAYLGVGANVLTTSNFSVTPQHLTPLGKLEALEELTERAGRLAFEAREALCTRVALGRRRDRSAAGPFSAACGVATSPAGGGLLITPVLDLSSPLVSPAPSGPASFIPAINQNPAMPSTRGLSHEYRLRGARVLIAGSLPPLCDTAALAASAVKAAAVTGGVSMSRTAAIAAAEEEVLRRIVDTLDPFVDLFLAESITSIPQALSVARAAMRTNKAVWVSWKLQDSAMGMPRLFSGETIPQAVDNLLQHLPRFVDAYLFNCSTPDTITSALPLLRKVTSRPIGALARLAPKVSDSSSSSSAGLAYGNGSPAATAPRTSVGDFQLSDKRVPPSVAPSSGVIGPKALSDALRAAQEVVLKAEAAPPTADEYAKIVRRWADVEGVRIVGGCCGVGPEHISAMARAFGLLPSEDSAEGQERREFVAASAAIAAGRERAPSSSTSVSFSVGVGAAPHAATSPAETPSPIAAPQRSERMRAAVKAKYLASEQEKAREEREAAARIKLVSATASTLTRGMAEAASADSAA